VITIDAITLGDLRLSLLVVLIILLSPAAETRFLVFAMLTTSCTFPLISALLTRGLNAITALTFVVALFHADLARALLLLRFELLARLVFVFPFPALRFVLFRFGVVLLKFANATTPWGVGFRLFDSVLRLAALLLRAGIDLIYIAENYFQLAPFWDSPPALPLALDFDSPPAFGDSPPTFGDSPPAFLGVCRILRVLLRPRCRAQITLFR